MEEDDGKKHPSLPSNYVTLVQLQQRWLEDKQRKQREKEEEEERKQKREQEQEESRKREEEEQANLKKRQSEAITSSRHHRLPFRKNSWIQADKSSRTIGIRERKPLESQVRAILVGDRDSKIDELKKKGKKGKKMRGKPRGTVQLLVEKEDVVEKIPETSTESHYEEERDTSKWKKRGKQRQEEDLTGRTEHLVLENDDVAEKIPVVSTERGYEKEGVTSEFRSGEIGRKSKNLSLSGRKGDKERNAGAMKYRGKPKVKEDVTIGTEQLLPINEVEAENIQVVSTERYCEFERKGKNFVVNGRTWEKKLVTVDCSAGIAGKFKDLSVRGAKGRNERNAGTRNDGRRYGGGSGSFNGRILHSPRDSNFVWVRKEEGGTFNANVARV